MILRLSPQIFVTCCMLAALHSFAQNKIPIKFGKVTPQDFAIGAPSSDTSAGAIVVADFGRSEFTGTPKLQINVLFHHSKRIRIMTRKGFNAANITIPLYASGNNVERVQDLRASTYTLEGGKVIETKLDTKSIFTDKFSKNLVNEKFTFPALKEGVILEYSYTQWSPFIVALQPWAFQGEYPCLWSEYQVDIPDVFKYVILSQGYLPFAVNTQDRGPYNVVTHRWVMTNIPALKEEPYTTTPLNYIAKIEFQLSATLFESVYRDMMGNWVSLSEGLLNSDAFGADLDNNNSWMDDELTTILKGATGSLEKAHAIYGYIRDNFICNSHGNLTLSNPLKTINKNKSGSEADLNLLLTAMLLHEKIKAAPVVLSTRSHGFANEAYPLLSRFNYVVTQVTLDSVYYLDASEPFLGFGRLPARCYNGYARVISKDAPGSVTFDPDSKTECKRTMVIISNDEKGGLEGQFQITPGFDEALETRQTIKEHGEQDYMKELQRAYSSDAVFSNLEMDSLTLPEQPLEVDYDFKLAPETMGDIFYFNPMMGEGYKQNPFKSAQRLYPVEMPAATDKVYILNMEIPKGYVVDELPNSVKVLLNNDDGFFEYVVEKSDQQIQFRTRVRLVRATYTPEDYATLRDFFAFVVKKESEQIVFRKIK